MNLTCTSMFCSQCFKERKFVPLHFAVAITGAARSSLYRWMDRGHIHFVVLPNGHRMICLDSLKKVHSVDLKLLASLETKARHITLPKGHEMMSLDSLRKGTRSPDADDLLAGLKKIKKKSRPKHD